MTSCERHPGCCERRGDWPSGMIPALGAGGREVDSRITPNDFRSFQRARNTQKAVFLQKKGKPKDGFEIGNAPDSRPEEWGFDFLWVSLILFRDSQREKKETLTGCVGCWLRSLLR